MSKYIFQQNDSFAVSLALGLIDGMEPLAQSGVSSPLVADTDTDVGLLGGTSIPLPSDVAEPMEVWSTDAGDTQDIQIFALGANGILIDPQIVTLTGTTPVSVPINMSRVNFMINISNLPVAGTISIGTQIASLVYCNILPEYQRSKQALYSVPDGYSAVIPSLIASLQKSSTPATDFSVLMTTKTKNFGQEFFYDNINFDLVRGGNSSNQFGDVFPNEIFGPSDIKISAQSSQVNATVTARFNGVLIKK